MTDAVPLAPFGFATAGNILFGRGQAEAALGQLGAFGSRLLVVYSTSVTWYNVLERSLIDSGCEVFSIIAKGEPDIDAVAAARRVARENGVTGVISVGGGSVIDLGKAVAALAPVEGDILDYLEGVGDGQALDADPLPFAAFPTTAGTGAEATKNAVISVPEACKKVSLRDARMLPNLAVVDPDLMDDAPRAVTLASGLDAVTQVIEPYLSSRANILTDALCEKAIPLGFRALGRLSIVECPRAREEMALVSLLSGIALANAGLGAVHGLAGVLGGRTGAPHGMICGRLLGPVILANEQAVRAEGRSTERFQKVRAWLSEGFDRAPDEVLQNWSGVLDDLGVPKLSPWLEAHGLCEAIAQEAAAASSMHANPVVLSQDALISILRFA
ncbi:MAG: iron-containing alcohol dehydrogenase [Roseobacter sp.]